MRMYFYGMEWSRILAIAIGIVGAYALASVIASLTSWIVSAIGVFVVAIGVLVWLTKSVTPSGFFS